VQQLEVSAINRHNQQLLDHSWARSKIDPMVLCENFVTTPPLAPAPAVVLALALGTV
jgi:hypothetical protein